MSRALVVAVGVNAEGRREVLGIACGPAETEAFWLQRLQRQASLTNTRIGYIQPYVYPAVEAEQECPLYLNGAAQC